MDIGDYSLFLVDLQVKPAFDKIGYGFSYTFRSERHTQAGGVLVLKQFLQYAYTGKLSYAQANPWLPKILMSPYARYPMHSLPEDLLCTPI